MSNHSISETLRFEWFQLGPHLQFSPQIGHLHAGCSKEVTVSFSSEHPVVLSTQIVKCKLCKIIFLKPVDQVPDWDDRQRTVKWVDVGHLPQQPAKKKVGKSSCIHCVLHSSCTLGSKLSSAIHQTGYLHEERSDVVQGRMVKGIARTSCTYCLKWLLVVEGSGFVSVKYEMGAGLILGCPYLWSRSKSLERMHITIR